MTIRELIKQKLDKLWQNFTNLTQDELSQILVELSALLGNIGENICLLEQKFINKQLELWQENNEMSAKECEIRSKVTKEYLEYSQIKVLEKATIESLRSIKYRLRILQNEQQGCRNL